MMRTGIPIARPVLIASALAACSFATSCQVHSRIVLTPSPSSGPSIQARAIAITDSIARQEGLKRRQSDYCSVPAAEGFRQGVVGGFWGSGSLSLTVCVERAEPLRIQILVANRGAFWNAKGKRIREQLPAALRATFGAEAVTVDAK